MRGWLFATMLAAAAWSSPAQAQHTASGGHVAGVNGGVVQDLGPFHAEVVAKGTNISVYLYDGKMKVVNTAGATARAAVQAGGQTTSVNLTPEAPNLLKGSGNINAGAGTKMVVFLTMPGQKMVQGRFANPD